MRDLQIFMIAISITFLTQGWFFSSVLQTISQNLNEMMFRAPCEKTSRVL